MEAMGSHEDMAGGDSSIGISSGFALPGVMDMNFHEDLARCAFGGGVRVLDAGLLLEADLEHTALLTGPTLFYIDVQEELLEASASAGGTVRVTDYDTVVQGGRCVENATEWVLKMVSRIWDVVDRASAKGVKVPVWIDVLEFPDLGRDEALVSLLRDFGLRYVRVRSAEHLRFYRQMGLVVDLAGAPDTVLEAFEDGALAADADGGVGVGRAGVCSEFQDSIGETEDTPGKADIGTGSDAQDTVDGVVAVIGNSHTGACSVVGDIAGGAVVAIGVTHIGGVEDGVFAPEAVCISEKMRRAVVASGGFVLTGTTPQFEDTEENRRAWAEYSAARKAWREDPYDLRARDRYRAGILA